MRAIAVAVLLFAATAASALPHLFLGTIGDEDVDLMLQIGDDERVSGVSWWPAAEPKHTWDMPLTTLRLVTGTKRGNRLQLYEWPAGYGPERTLIEARYSERELRGTWRRRGGKAEAFELWAAYSNQSPLASGAGPYGWPSGQLHDAIRAGNWPMALYFAQLLCGVSEYACNGWVDAIPLLAAGQAPPPREGVTPWQGLLLERQGRVAEAIAVDRQQCELRAHMSCAFLADLLPPGDPAFELTCANALIGCGEVFGRREAALVDAAHRGDLAAAAKLMLQPVNVNVGKSPFHTPLFAAVESQSLPIVILLLARGADPNLDGGYETPLEYAVDGNMDAIAMVLLHHGARATASQSLWTAAYNRKLPIVRKMLANGERPDDSLVPAGSPLTAAVDNGDVQMVRELLAHGSDPEITTNHSQGSPIDHARRDGKREILRMLLRTASARRAQTPAAAAW